LSIERLLSGKGLLNIYEALSNIRTTPTKFHSAIDIGISALRGDDPICIETFEIFFAILGSVAGNQALTVGSQGGVYIAGGIAPKYLDLLKSSPFREKFMAKGRMAHYLGSIPTFVITHKNPGLIGAASLLTSD
jgi:glucokinase